MKLYACIISEDAKRDKTALLSIAQQFSYSIELLPDGILFDVTGLQNLVGDANRISQTILAELKKNSVSGSIAISETVDVASLLAHGQRSAISDQPSDPKSNIQNPKWECHIASPDTFSQLPLQNLLIDDDTLNVFHDLGIRSIRDLQQIPKDELVARYGQQFTNVIDVIEQKGRHFLTPNVKDNQVSWNYQLDFPVDNFEQLIFILNHGLDKLLAETSAYGFSTEYLDIFFRLQDRTERSYEIKTSFPTLDKTFWLKLINLRISLDPPESEILGIHVTSHFTPPRPAQRGLYAVTRPDPERLLLTVNKLKKLVGEENVGVPLLLDQRVEKAFALDAEAVPEGKDTRDVSNAERGTRNAESEANAELGVRNAEFVESSAENDGLLPHGGLENSSNSAFRVPHSAFETFRAPPSAFEKGPIIAFSYFEPPIPAEVLVRDKKLVFLRTQYFNGRVTRYSGVWKASSKWWDKSWKTQEWDVEIENYGVYRLCKVNKDWFLVGEYD